MKIDAHQHFWKYDPIRGGWIDESMIAIRQDFLPTDLAPILHQNGISGCIAVQAEQSEEETQFLLGLADKNSFIKGVVGWVDLLSDNVDQRLASLSKDKKLKGIRHIVQGEPEGFMLREDFQHGISKLEKYNLTYDILVYPNQLVEAVKLVDRFPNQPFVLDHIAKPNIKEDAISSWGVDLKRLADFPNTHCKISGMVTEADWKNWQQDDIRPYLEVVFDSFGVDRIMFGSDWPVCLLAGKYSKVLGVVKNYIEEFSENEKTKIMGGNALRVYNLSNG